MIESTVAAPTPAPAAASAGLSAGASAGIAVAAVATFLVAAGLLVARRKRIEKDDEYYATGAQALADADQNARDARELKGADEGDAAAGGAMLGASQANYCREQEHTSCADFCSSSLIHWKMSRQRPEETTSLRMQDRVDGLQVLVIQVTRPERDSLTTGEKAVVVLLWQQLVPQVLLLVNKTQNKRTYQ